MKTPGMDQYKKREWLSISSLASFSRCPRKYFYGSGCRLSTPDPKAPLVFGEAIHAALPWILKQDMKQAIDAFDEIWEETIADKKNCRERALHILMDFQSHHVPGKSIYNLQDPPAERLPIPGVSPFEVPFAIDIGLPVPLVGRLDALGRHRDDGGIWGIEWKTSSEISDRFYNAFDRNTQVAIYTLALQTMTGQEVRGVMVEALRKSVKTTETSLQPYYMSPTKIKDALEWAQWKGTELLEMEKLGHFPKNMSACTPYQEYGMPGYQCDFHHLCDVEDWRELEDSFVVSQNRKFDEGLRAMGRDIPVKKVEL